MNYNIAQQIFENSRKRKLANNTYLTKGDGYYGIRLHATEIIRFYEDRIVLDSGGWLTVTTKARLNEFTPFDIWQKQGIWYISHTGTTSDIVFADGITYKDGIWSNVGENPKQTAKLRNKVKKYSKDFTEALFSGEVPKPSTGDCWYCSMVTVENHQPLGEAVKDESHILNHIDEKYYVPSLLVNATNMFPISMIAESCIGELWQNGKSSGWGADIAKIQIQSAIRRYCYRQLNMA